MIYHQTKEVKQEALTGALNLTGILDEVCVQVCLAQWELHQKWSFFQAPVYQSCYTS